MAFLFRRGSSIHQPSTLYRFKGAIKKNITKNPKTGVIVGYWNHLTFSVAFEELLEVLGKIRLGDCVH